MFYFRYIFLLAWVLYLCRPGCGYAQNLVPNGDFEQGAKCQTTYTKPSIPKPWQITGTPDLYLDSCEIISPSNNLTGACELLSGKAFAGLVMDLPRKQNGYWVERLQTRLLQRLEKDSLYQLSMFISLGPNSPSSIKQMSVRLATEIHAHYTPPKEIKVLDMPEPLLPGKWIHIVDTIKAVGGEQLLVIGNYLKEDDFVKLRKPKGNEIRCYIYLDSISLTPLFKLASPPIISDTITLAGINFNTNEAILLPAAYPVLDNILLPLLKSDNFSLTIIGHTDSIGSIDNNLSLSLARAESVKAYFTINGIGPHLITIEGSGPLKPIAPNNTESGRAINRRVEIVIKRQR
jgi:outer membrane protein OmpA-like peptidoglycan-associated protein